MLCALCETCLTNILHQDFTTWRRVRPNEGWYTFKHGNHATVTAAAQAGCELCALFNQVRIENIPNYEQLNEKWHVLKASIDVNCEDDSGQLEAKHSRWTFQLLTVAPEMSWIAFEIFQPDTNETTLVERDAEAPNWSQAVSLDPTSYKSVNTAKEWIDNCLNRHSLCSRPERAPLPTRVIDVGYTDGIPNPRLQINRGHLGRYLTLSHCWGGGDRVTLTKRKLHAFQQAIPFGQLPKTFQDAIELTRLLGLRYLWIDALCIVQDDQNDWRKESASMCAVFENAELSISALSATDSHSGMLHERSHAQISAHVNGVPLGIRKRLDSLLQARGTSRLQTRAWCYQERLLSRGILHIAPAQMYWECRTCTASEAMPHNNTPNSVAYENRDNSTSLASNNISHVGLGHEWLHLVSAYSERQITRASDRLPAIAGLADKAKKELGNVVYMQGLWSHDLHAGLAWKRRNFIHGKVIPSRDKYFSRSSPSAAARPLRPIAPSWSWASINDAVDYVIYDDCKCRLPSAFDAVFGSYDASGNDVSARSQGYLQLEGLVKRGSCKPSSNSLAGPDAGTFRPSGSLLIDDGLICFFDYVDDPVSKSCYCLRIADWSQTLPAMKKRGTRGHEERVFCLIVERVVHDWPNESSDGDTFGSFKRIGMVFDLSDKVDKIFANAERRHLRLF